MWVERIGGKNKGSSVERIRPVVNRQFGPGTNRIRPQRFTDRTSYNANLRCDDLVGESGPS